MGRLDETLPRHACWQRSLRVEAASSHRHLDRRWTLGMSGIGVTIAAVLAIATLPTSGAEPSLDALSVETGHTTLSSTSFSHDMPSSQNRLLLVSASWDDANDVNISSMSYGNDDLACLDPAKRSPQIGTQSCYLVAPPTGTNTLNVSWSADVPEWVIVARSLSCVDQTQPLGATSLTDGTGTAASDTLTTEEPDSTVFAQVANENADVSLNAVGSTVEDTETTAGVSSLGISAAAGRLNTTTADNYTIGWDLTSAEAWVLDVAEVRRVPEQVSFDNASGTVDESAGTATVDIGMEPASSNDVNVDYEWTGGNASRDDHNLSAGTATIGAGTTSTALTFDVTGDTADEPDETIEITLTDAIGGETSSPTVHTLTITDDDANSAPTPDALSVSTDEDTSVSDTVTASDADQNDTIDHFTVEAGPSDGALSFDAPTGAFTYTPDADFHGDDSFTFTATDEHGATSGTAAVSIAVDAVNDAPSAVDDAASTDEDDAVWVSVIANDTDVDGDTLSVAGAAAPSNGATSVPGNGTVKYAPDPDWNGEDSFTYDVTDGSLTAQATVSVTVTAVNDGPVASNDSASTAENETVWVPVLANDTDVDDQGLSVASAGPPTDGSTRVPGNGTVAYTPDPGFSGTDSFTYDATDGSLTDTATVTVDVDPAGGGLGGIEILSSSVRVLDDDLATAPDLVTNTTDASVHLQLENTTGGIDLAEIGASNTTTIAINLTTRNFTPIALMGRTQVVDWSNATNEDGTENVSLELQPIAMAFIDDCEAYDPFMGYCGPASTEHWPTNTSEDRAEVSFEAGLRVFLSDLSYLNATMRDRLQGAYMTTDAQALGRMNISGAKSAGGASLSMPVAGPHTLPDGSQNDGFFEARLPDGMLSWWGIDEPSRLTGEYEGDNRTVAISNVTDGIEVHMGIHYSSGEVAITEDETDPVADAGEDVTVDVGETIQLDGSTSTDNQAVDSYAWDLGDGTTKDGATVDHAWNEAGSYALTLTVADGADNSDQDTVNVTVEASRSGGGSRGAGGGGGGKTPGGDAGDEAETDDVDPEAEGKETTRATTPGGSPGSSPAEAVLVSGPQQALTLSLVASDLEPTPSRDGGTDHERSAEEHEGRSPPHVWLMLVPVAVIGIRRYAPSTDG